MKLSAIGLHGALATQGFFLPIHIYYHLFLKPEFSKEIE